MSGVLRFCKRRRRGSQEKRVLITDKGVRPLQGVGEKEAEAKGR